MDFSKWTGLGNDFIIINSLNHSFENINETASAMCNRHFGIGADGLLLVLPSDKADIRMQLINADGSESDMCGNAIRCFAKYVYQNKIITKKNFSVETLAGQLSTVFSENGNIEVNMGIPRYKRAEVPMRGNPEETSLNAAIQLDETPITGSGISMGTPHFVVNVEDMRKINLLDLGPKIELHADFPKKTNVEFIQILDRQNIRMRVWRKGTGLAMACGTGACAAAAAAILNGHTEREVNVILDGGTLKISWPEDNGPIYMTGGAAEIFRGKYLLPL
ncbi:diaminopimelate epimerase [Parelusimicrobium proximum]|uniref:diaminopimelate epimerase n=1 Tax=Parelusimicrobium proximum TaxID=3228953 RepID=UPI003D16E0AB